EGLELTEFHDFQAWCVAEREHARRQHATLLRALTERYAPEPEKAREHAQALVQVDPLDAEARAELVSLLLTLNRRAEAEELIRSSRRLFKELGSPEPNSLRLAASRLTSAPPKRPPPPLSLTSTDEHRLTDAAPSSTMQLAELPPIVGRKPV